MIKKIPNIIQRNASKQSNKIQINIKGKAVSSKREI